MSRPDRKLGGQELNEETIAGHISAMMDSVTLVNQEIEKTFSSDIGARVKANIDHLSYMLSKDFIIADSCSKTVFNDAISAGQAYLDANS